MLRYVSERTKSGRTWDALDDEVEQPEALWVDVEMTVLNDRQ